MKSFATLLWISIFFTRFCFAQGNLITNGSFENYSGTCPLSSPNGAFGQVLNWSPANIVPGHGVPHAELYCQGTPNYGNCLPGPVYASDGDAYVGFHTRNISPQYNEAIYQILAVPLVAGNNYRVSFDLITCQSGLFTLGPSDFCVYANNDTIVPGCPTQNPAVVLMGCVPFAAISNTIWSHHEIDFVAVTNSNVLAFSGGACFTTDVYYYLDHVQLTETTGLNEHNQNALNYVVNPNVFTSEFYIEINDPGEFSLEFYDDAARQVLSTKISGPGKMEITSASHLPKGIYFLKISNQQKCAVSKLVKM